MIPLEGDIKLYVFDLAVIVFTGIKHTAEWFLAAFKDNQSTACKSFFLLSSPVVSCLTEVVSRLCAVEPGTGRALLRYVQETTRKHGRPQDHRRLL